MVCLLLVSGCGGLGLGTSGNRQTGYPAVDCIGVLPASPQVTRGSSVADEQENKRLRRGADVMDVALKQELEGARVRFVGSDRIASLEQTGGESPLKLARMVGRSVGCNAVLETTVKRFTERVGTRYSIESPASVAFEMRMYDLEKGSVFWSAKFDEVQKSVMENVLEWSKARTRKFVWITAGELLREGVKAKISTTSLFYPGDASQGSNSTGESK